MAVAHITLEDGTDLGLVEVPDWMAPNVPDYLTAVDAFRLAASELAEATADRAAAEAVFNSKTHNFKVAQDNVEAIMNHIMRNIGGS
jgi:hypothetical protein